MCGAAVVAKSTDSDEKQKKAYCSVKTRMTLLYEDKREQEKQQNTARGVEQ